MDESTAETTTLLAGRVTHHRTAERNGGWRNGDATERKLERWQTQDQPRKNLETTGTLRERRQMRRSTHAEITRARGALSGCSFQLLGQGREDAAEPARITWTKQGQACNDAQDRPATTLTKPKHRSQSSHFNSSPPTAMDGLPFASDMFFVTSAPQRILLLSASQVVPPSFSWAVSTMDVTVMVFCCKWLSLLQYIPVISNIFPPRIPTLTVSISLWSLVSLYGSLRCAATSPSTCCSPLSVARLHPCRSFWDRLHFLANFSTHASMRGRKLDIL